MRELEIWGLETWSCSPSCFHSFICSLKQRDKKLAQQTCNKLEKQYHTRNTPENQIAPYNRINQHYKVAWFDHSHSSKTEESETINQVCAYDRQSIQCNEQTIGVYILKTSKIISANTTRYFHHFNQRPILIKQRSFVESNWIFVCIIQTT